MEVQQQNALFQYFSDTLTAVIQNAKKNGRYDMGILGKRKTSSRICFEDEFDLNTFEGFVSGNPLLQIWALGMRRSKRWMRKSS